MFGTKVGAEALRATDDKGAQGMAIILHVIGRDEWEAARPAPDYRPPSLPAEGFIH